MPKRSTMVFDCSRSPDCGTCRELFTGSAAEVLAQALAHAKNRHALPDSPQLREHLRSQIHEAAYA